MSLSLADRQAILALLHQEVVPALGCTEPIALAYCAATLRKVLKHKRLQIPTLRLNMIWKFFPLFFILRKIFLVHITNINISACIIIGVTV